jgi:NAD(P)-dependent dehydrogenase (short-subunit alcohol dehydrogenase family)
VVGLAEAGADLILVGRSPQKLAALADRVSARAYVADPLDLAALKKVAEQIERIDGLVCGIGGNRPEASLPPDGDFFGLKPEALREVFDLNLFGGFLMPLLAFGPCMSQGSIVTISSVSAGLPLTRVGAYGAAKAAVANFTQWAAVELGQRSQGKIRVNSIQPGFFLTEQNRFLLIVEATGEPTDRGAKILAHTPAGRYGSPEDLIGALVFLLSDSSSFVTGTVLPVDGGFTAWWGV